MNRDYSEFEDHPHRGVECSNDFFNHIFYRGGINRFVNDLTGFGINMFIPANKLGSVLSLFSRPSCQKINLHTYDESGRYQIPGSCSEL